MHFGVSERVIRTFYFSHVAFKLLLTKSGELDHVHCVLNIFNNARQGQNAVLKMFERLAISSGKQVREMFTPFNPTFTQ